MFAQPEAADLPQMPADCGPRGHSRPGATRRLLAASISVREARLHRQQRLLHLAMQLAGTSRLEDLYAELLAEAVVAVGGTGGIVFRWCERRQTLDPALASGQALALHAVAWGAEPAGRAAAARRTVEVASPGAATHAAGAAAPGAVLAVPLEHAGRLLGVLLVCRAPAAGGFVAEDRGFVEQLAEVGAATIRGVEQARLEGARLAVRTLQHELNNRLTLTSGYAALLADDPELPAHLRQMAHSAARGAIDASDTLLQLGQLAQLRELRWGSAIESTLEVPTCQI